MEKNNNIHINTKKISILIILFILPFIIWGDISIISIIKDRCNISINGYIINIIIILLIVLLFIFILALIIKPNINKTFYLLSILLLIMLVKLSLLIWLLVTIDLSQISNINIYKILGVQITKVKWFPEELENIYIEYINKLDRIFNFTKDTKDELYKILKISDNPEILKERINAKIQMILTENNSWSHYIKSNLGQIIFTATISVIIILPVIYWGYYSSFAIEMPNPSPSPEVYCRKPEVVDLFEGLTGRQILSIFYNKIEKIDKNSESMYTVAFKKIGIITKDLLIEHVTLHEMTNKYCDLSPEIKLELIKYISTNQAHLINPLFERVNSIGPITPTVEAALVRVAEMGRIMQNIL